MKNTLVERGLRWRGLGLVAALLFALLLPGCSDDSSDVGGAPRATIFVSVVPNPVIGVQNLLTGSVSAAYIVNIRELAGLGGTVQFVNSTVFDPENGVQVATNYFDSADLKVFVGTDRVEAGGELDVSQSVNYTLPDFRVVADMSVAVQLIDDRGSLINYTALVRIVPPEQPVP